MTTLIVGCGYVGSALGAQLATDGERVFGMRRGKTPPATGVETVAADVSEPAMLRDAIGVLPAIEQVVYAVSPGGRTEEAYRSAYVDGVGHVLEALEAAKAPVRRFVLVTSTGVYGQNQGEWVDETSATEPGTPFGQRLLDGERRAAAGPYPSVAMRLAGIYGPGRTRLVEHIRRGEARLPVRARYTNRMHRDDCAGAIRHVLALSAPEPIYLGVDSEPARLGDVYSWIARELAVSEPPMAEESTGIVGTGSNKRCSSARLLDSGYELRYPTFRDGYRELIRATSD